MTRPALRGLSGAPPARAASTVRCGLFDFLKPGPAGAAAPARTWVDDVKDERRNGKGLRDAQTRRARVSELMADPVKMKAEKARQREAKKASR